MTIKVIGAGFGRTGTGSLHDALEILGFIKCYHMFDIVFDDISKANSWINASKGLEINWDSVFEGYQAAVDWPEAAFYKEILKKYPDAKVILTVRDPDKWYKSTYDTIYTLSASIPSWLSWISPKIRKISQLTNSVIWDGTFDGNFENKEFAKEILEKHIEEVKRTVPENQLLIYQVSEGWEPLAKFLGVNIPEGKPFPRVNDTEELKKRANMLFLISKALYISLGAMLLLILYYVLK